MRLLSPVMSGEKQCSNKNNTIMDVELLDDKDARICTTDAPSGN